jgi:transposase
MDLEIKHEVACGLDVHSATIAACLVRTGPNGGPKYEERSFPTTQRGLTELREWLVSAGCQAVGMEATGVYWMPVYAALEGHVALVVGNPGHMKNLRGHKTDRKDARWIASLVRHGLIRPSYVPTPEFRDARELTRFRRQLIQARTTVRNEILRGLASQGIPLAKVLSNVFGVSGMGILEALAEGRPVLEELSKLVHRSVRGKLPALTAALESPLDEVPRWLLALQLERLEELEGNIQAVEGRIATHMEVHRGALDLLTSIPGVGLTAACIILAEIGVDMSHWPTERHLSAWAGVAPGSRESGGKRMSSATRKGNVHMTTILVEAAGAAVRAKGCHLVTVFHRLRARMGYKKAVVAIARKLLVIIYKLLGRGTPYQEPQPEDASEKAKERAIKKRVKDLNRLGFDVVLNPRPSTEASI